MDQSTNNSLQAALSTKINLQITISSLPIVTEDMDPDISRWIDAIPLPPEMPDGKSPQVRVTLGTDLSRVRWGAFGHPGGMIPKMSEYLQKSGMTSADLQLIDGLGNALEPNPVGSWVGVDGVLRTGWQFCEPMPLADLAPHLGSTEAKAKLLKYAEDHGITTFNRWVQSVGREARSEIELALPGDEPDAQLDPANAAFEGFLNEPIPEPVKGALLTTGQPGLAVTLRIVAGYIETVGLVMPKCDIDVVSKLCSETGIAYDSKLVQIIGMMQSSGPNKVEYRRRGDETFIDVELIPQEVERQAPDVSKN